MTGPSSSLFESVAALAARHGLSLRPLADAVVRELDAEAAATSAPPEGPGADCLIVHGACSRLDAAQRAGLFAHVARGLAPSGVAVVACDALPGALDLAPLRALMRFHVVRVQDPASAIAQARAIARWHLERTRRVFSDANLALMERVVAEVELMADDALLRVLRDPTWEPLSLVDLAAELGRHGLRWLADVTVRDDGGPDDELPPTIEHADHGDDPLIRQQYLDFFRMTRWRQSLVVATSGLGPAVTPALGRAITPNG